MATHTADHELLVEIDAALHPETGFTAGLIHAVYPLGDDPFQAVFPHECEHLLRDLV
jgi:hypothetical protein